MTIENSTIKPDNDDSLSLNQNSAGGIMPTGTHYSKRSKNIESKTHCWEGLKEHQLYLKYTEGIILLSFEERKDTLEKELKINEYTTITTLPASEHNTKKFENYIRELNELGMNIGHGESNYGYKMPLAENGEEFRKLIIFRRK